MAVGVLLPFLLILQAGVEEYKTHFQKISNIIYARRRCWGLSPAAGIVQGLPCTGGRASYTGRDPDPHLI
jgi:hypothetical protein